MNHDDLNRDSAGGPTWTLAGVRAEERNTGRAVSGEVFLDYPDRGLAFPAAAAAGMPQSLRMLGLDLAPAAGRAAAKGRDGRIEPSDSWVRGTDLVAVYEPQDPRAVRVTAMWRHWPTHATAIAAWELIVSSQTSLLESDAAMAVVSTARAEGVLVTEAGVAEPRWRVLGADPLDSPPAGVLMRCSGGGSVLAAVHPSDARRIVVHRPTTPAGSASPPVSIECWLFSSLVEKGVLLRGRTLAAIGPTEGDVDWANMLVKAFASSPPVLTA